MFATVSLYIKNKEDNGSPKESITIEISPINLDNSGLFKLEDCLDNDSIAIENFSKSLYSKHKIEKFYSNLISIRLPVYENAFEFIKDNWESFQEILTKLFLSNDVIFEKKESEDISYNSKLAFYCTLLIITLDKVLPLSDNLWEKTLELSSLFQNDDNFDFTDREVFSEINEICEIIENFCDEEHKNRYKYSKRIAELKRIFNSNKKPQCILN